ncbi:hypothetical protein [Fluviicola chungangensis]|uniref:Uncharacterized protein n=1 Tax=Fluviicola chungangensis TaxID=2597671 RepID=A0A556MMI3_9FLAO|nr:hypothetical protein [Fluviicola chungangensis]TSJ41157.1 hypothetical protein FO442_14690 [Fluviicola chungangensis]
MKSEIGTIDALLAEEKSYPVENLPTTEPNGIKIGIIGFQNVQYRERLQRSISKIINPSTIIDEN